MKFKKALVWSCLHAVPHPALSTKERRIEGMMPLVKALFPGVNYYSITGFAQVMAECVVPVLSKLFPELKSVQAGSIEHDEMVEVGEFLPSKGYEWQTSKRWRAKFRKALAA